jgi:hypothetical protein
MGDLADMIGVDLAAVPDDGCRFLSVLLSTGKHRPAMVAAGISATRYADLHRLPPFRDLLRAIRDGIEDLRREVCDDFIFSKATRDSPEADRLLMWRAERRDPRYSPPNSPARTRRGDGQPQVVVNIMLAPGQSVTVGSGMGFLGPVIGQARPA